MTTATSAPASAPPLDATTIRRVILASSLGTLFEWYDFYLYGSLAVFFGGLFFPPGNDRAALLASLATFGAGFGVRPLGAIVFGRLGDLIGRKYTFLVTMITMGLATALTGLLPTYASVGIVAPILLVTLRLLQGLALGGEYGGAATYVAEHVPDDKRGYYTSFIQTTATLGFFVSLAVIGATRLGFGPDAFKSYGWRVPFLVSFVLLGVSVYIRMKMNESPLFARLKTEGRLSKNPLKESFGNPTNLKFVLLALFGATAGQGVVWYSAQFYALTFLQKPLNLDWTLAYPLVAIALALSTPLFVFFGRLSDRIGRKKVMMTGLGLAALTYFPIFIALQRLANPDMVAKVSALPTANAAGIVGLLTLLMVYVTMVYGPIAAFLVELFPTSIRYTSMSLPYHIGNGWFGGFLPLIATAAITSPSVKATFGAYAIFAGLIYPVAICLVSLVVGGLLIHETKDHKIDTPIRVGLGVIVLLGILLPGAAARAGTTDKRLDVYWIDVEGGAATLIVTPAGETVLFDAGNPGDRDVPRIVKALTETAGRTRIDHLVITHLHADHYGGVAELTQKVPVGVLYENGIETAPATEQKDKLIPGFRAAKVEKRVLVNPGDVLPLLQVDGAAPLKITFLGGREEFVDPGVVTRKRGKNRLCAKAITHDADPTDNKNSVNTIIEFGPFRFFDGGDTTWNTEATLVCPHDRVGSVDVFQVNHHGADESNNPVLVRTLAPTVAVFNNGTTKGCGAASFATVKETKSVKAIYQVHKQLRTGAEHNTADAFIANQVAACAGEFIKLSVAPDGKNYALSVPSTGHVATYQTRRR